MKQRREFINPGSECTVQERSISLQQSVDHEEKEIEDAKTASKHVHAHQALDYLIAIAPRPHLIPINNVDFLILFFKFVVYDWFWLVF